MRVEYVPKGVCSRKMTVDVDENGVIQEVKIIGGCNGNLQGITKLVTGRTAQEVIDLLADIKCGFKDTSCPAQLSIALKQAISETVTK